MRESVRQLWEEFQRSTRKLDDTRPISSTFGAGLAEDNRSTPVKTGRNQSAGYEKRVVPARTRAKTVAPVDDGGSFGDWPVLAAISEDISRQVFNDTTIADDPFVIRHRANCLVKGCTNAQSAKGFVCSPHWIGMAGVDAKLLTRFRKLARKGLAVPLELAKQVKEVMRRAEERVYYKGRFVNRKTAETGMAFDPAMEDGSSPVGNPEGMWADPPESEGLQGVDCEDSALLYGVI